jgi:hypothetical protein
MDHEHSFNGPTGCKRCDARRAIDFGQGSREQSFRGLADPIKPVVVKTTRD